MPVNSKLIHRIESELPGTTFHVNNDEDAVMADGLLDLELDTVLGQSTRDQLVSRVPSKSCDSQTSNSRPSPELCCKDPPRSDNNSTFVEDTLAPVSPGMPSLEMTWDPEPAPPTSTTKHLPHQLETTPSWTTPATEMEMKKYRGDDNNRECRLCQQRFTTHCRLRVHLPQHFITTFCPCGEYSYNRDHVLHHQRTMHCFKGHVHDVDESSYPSFLEIIRPLITDSARLSRLEQGFPPPRPVIPGPVGKPSESSNSPPLDSVRRPQTLPSVVLQRVDTQAYTLLPPLPPTQRKRHRCQRSPSRSSPLARNLREVETWANELEQEVYRLAPPRIHAASSELRSLQESIRRLKRATQD